MLDDSSHVLIMRRRLPDVSKLHRFTGWHPRVPFDQTLEQVLAAARERPGDE